MLAAALRAEAASFVAQFERRTLPDGRQRVVRHGTGPERMIQTGIGPIPVQRQKVRDRAAGVPPEKKIRFTSNILPKWARRSKSLDALLPVLYLRGISTGDFQEALTALLGTDAPNLSPGVISRLTAGWQENYDRWQRRDLSARRYVYVWADGVYLQARMEPQAECILVIHRGDARRQEGTRRLPCRCAGERAELARASGRHQGPRALRSHRRSPSVTAPWGSGRRSTRSSRARGISDAGSQDRQRAEQVPEIDATGREGPTCVRSGKPRPAPPLRQRSNTFAAKYGAKYEKAVSCLTKDREALLAFYDFPAEHWDHPRTGNPIESVFATVRHRTVRTKGALSQKTAKLMVFKLVRAAAKTWRRLKGANQLPTVIEGVTFTDGVANHQTETRAA